VKVRVVNKAPNELKLEVDGVGHTLCNLLQKGLLEEESVELAGYDIPHPMTSTAIIYVRTKGRVRPEDVLKRALAKARERNMEFGKEFERALKKA
jgi:DNA-directed RNA polymerase subunit L